MAALKALTAVILSGSVVHAGSVFECPDSLASSLIERGFAQPLKEAEGVGGFTPTLDQPDISAIEENDEVERMREDYQRMTIPELVELAKANDINTTPLTRKSEYIDALVNYELGE